MICATSFGTWYQMIWLAVSISTPTEIWLVVTMKISVPSFRASLMYWLYLAFFRLLGKYAAWGRCWAKSLINFLSSTKIKVFSGYFSKMAWTCLNLGVSINLVGVNCMLMNDFWKCLLVVGRFTLLVELAMDRWLVMAGWSSVGRSR